MSNYPLWECLSNAHGLTLLETELDDIIRLANQVSTVSEPTTPGFYWWRRDSHSSWRMVHVIDLLYSLGCPPSLSAFDVEHKSFGGKTISVWKAHQPLGEWIAVERPGE